MKTFLGKYFDEGIISRIAFSCFKIVLIIGLCFIAVKISNKIISKFFGTNKLFSDGKRKTLRTIFRGISKTLIYFVGACNILPYFNISVASILTVAGVGSLAIGFAAQGLVKDFITGMFIIIEDQFNIGDLIIVNGITGIVEDMTMRVTKIRSNDGGLNIVPNGQITILTSMNKKFTRALVDVEVAYDCDIDKIIDILNDEMNSLWGKLEDLLTKPEVLGISQLTENYINIRISADCKPTTHYKIEREIRLILKKRFEKENINPPQRIIQMKRGNDGI